MLHSKQFLSSVRKTFGVVFSSLFVSFCPLYCLMHFSEYRLSEDANPDRAMLVGFELLLARVEYYRLLELLDKDQLKPQVKSEIIQPCFI